MITVATLLQNKTAMQAVQEPEYTAVQLAHVSAALKRGRIEDAMDCAHNIRNKAGHSQAIQKVVGHMVCCSQSIGKAVQVATSIPIAAFANDVLRNLLLSRILLKEFDEARRILPHIVHDIRRGLRPQIDFVENNHENLEYAQKRAQGLIHPDDIALTLALVAGAMGNYAWMSKFSRSVSAPLLVGTHTTYSISLAYAGKGLEAITLLGNIQEDQHEYFLRLGYLVFNVPLSQPAAKIVLKTFVTADRYEGAIAHWYHQILEHLVCNNVTEAFSVISAIRNDNLTKALATLLAEFAFVVKTASDTH